MTPVRLFYTDEGRVDGDPIVLVHGWTCDSHDWSFQLAEFGARHRVIAVDLRGHGRSPAPESGYDPRSLAHDVAAVLIRANVESAVGIGHSLGGLVVAALAVEYPRLVRASVVVDPAYGMDAERAEHVPALLAALDAPDGATQLATVLTATDRSAPSWLQHWHYRRILGSPAGINRQILTGMYLADDQFGVRPQTEQYLAARQSPTLAVYRASELATWEAGLLADRQSRAVAWTGVGHWLHQERPEDFASLVLPWIAALG